MPSPDVPPAAFFKRFGRICIQHKEQVELEGYLWTGWEVIFRPQDSPSWWDAVRLVSYGEDGRGRKKHMTTDIDVKKMSRRIRRTKKSEERAEVTWTVSDGFRVWALELRQDELNRLKAAFTYPNPEFKKRERMGYWTGGTPKTIESYRWDGETLVLPRGGIEKIRAVVGEPLVHERYIDPPPIEIDIKEGAERIELRPDQRHILDQVERFRTCLIRAPTAMGKTECTIGLIEKLRTPTLIIVWQSNLLDQWVERICRRWGWREKDLGILGSGKKRVRPVTVAMQQTLIKMIDDVKDEWGLVVADECQRFAAKTFREVISYFTSPYRVGISADERRKDRLNVLIEDHFGEVAVDIKKEDMISRGAICEVDVVAVPTGIVIQEVEDCPRTDRGALVGQMWKEIVATLAASEARNRIIVDLVVDRIHNDETVMIFTNRVGHVRKLQEMIEAADVECGACIGGPKNRAHMDQTLERLKEGSLKVAVGTSCVYQGVDVPRLTTGIVALPTATNQQLLEQQVGRLRRRFPGKDRGRLYYLWDEDVFPSHLDNLRRYYGSRLVSLYES